LDDDDNALATNLDSDDEDVRLPWWDWGFSKKSVIVAVSGLVIAVMVFFVVSVKSNGDHDSTADTPTPSLSASQICSYSVSKWIDALSDSQQTGQSTAVLSAWLRTVGHNSPLAHAVVEDSSTYSARSYEIGAKAAADEMLPKVHQQCDRWTASGVVIPDPPQS
jgi:hypothetical protein